MDISHLFALIQKTSAKSIWSRGVELARVAAVTRDPGDEDEIVLRVTVPVVLHSPLVHFFPEDDDWTCDCNPDESICDHIVAAIVTLKNSDKIATTDEMMGRLAYRFKRAGQGLSFQRSVIYGDVEQILTGAVDASALSRDRVVVTPNDVKIENVIGYKAMEWVEPPTMVKLLRLMRRATEVTLDGGPVRLSTRSVGMVGKLIDVADGFRVTVEQDSRIDEVFNNGVALCGDTLRPISDGGLTGREILEFRRGRSFHGAMVSELVNDVLPRLAERIKIDIQTDKLPGTTRLVPYLTFDVSVDGSQLSVLPRLVYGDPPIARVTDDGMELFSNEVPLRDYPEERRLIQKLERKMGLVLGHSEAVESQDAVRLAAQLKQDNALLKGDDLAAFELLPVLTPEIELNSHGFTLRFGCGTRGEANTLEVMKAFHDGQELVPVQGGGWAPLPVDWLAQYGEIISDLLATKEMGEALPKCLLPDLGRLCAALEHPAPPELAAFEQLVGDFDGLPEASLPDDLLATLRGYQKKGVDWLNFLKTAGMGGLLADDMGLGKTIQALCAMNGRSLVVAPTSVLHNWQSEIERFRPSLSINLYHGSGRQLDASANVTLTTYAILRLDVDALSEVSWNMVVLDEAQAIKNPSSQVAQGAFRLQGDFKLTLTGTPVENRLEELWSQMHFINPGLLGANSHFKKHYVKPISSGDRAVSERLRRRIKPFILRRLKSEVAPELPPRTEQVLHCVLSEEERKLYESIVATTRAEVVAKFGKGGNAFAALEALLRLRQAACHPQLVSQSGGGTHSAKLALMMERLDAMVAEGHKALVFSQWTSLLDKVEPLLNEAGIKFVRLDGSTRDRQGVVSTFQSDKGPPVMLLSLKAGGTGLNLTAADHVILLDPWWNPAAEDQAADRAHRIGQDKPVLIYRLVAKNTVEERVLLLQDKKRALADAVLSGSDGAASLTRDDLMWLLD